MSLQKNIFITATAITCINQMPVVLHLIHSIFIFIIHFIPYILYQDPHEDETMPAWPPLILDQSNNLLVKMAMMNDCSVNQYSCDVYTPSKMQT